MATAFPIVTYPLDTSTRFQDHTMTRATKMASGPVHIHLLSDDTYRTINCRFSPAYGVDADALIQYLRTNRVTEFDVDYNGTTYRGYFIGDIETENRDGDVAFVSVEFYGITV